MIQQQHSSHGIIGEEWGNHQSDAEYQWILDPIDGTRAFACGIPTFGTLIGLRHKGEMLLGIINQPISGERWVGVAGKPSLYRSANTAPMPIATSSCAALSHARLATTSPYLFSEVQKPRFERLRRATAIQNYGGDCYNYALLASGHIDVVVEAGLNPYDILPLLPILHGAEAVITDWEGGELNLASPKLDVLVSSNHALHREALQVMSET